MTLPLEVPDSRCQQCPRTTSTLPRSALTGWLDAVAGYNPVTYLLDGLRALISEGWAWEPIGKALLAIALVGRGLDVDVLRRPAGPGEARLMVSTPRTYLGWSAPAGAATHARVRLRRPSVGAWPGRRG